MTQRPINFLEGRCVASARWIVIAVLTGFSSVYAVAAPYGILLMGPMFAMRLPYVPRSSAGGLGRTLPTTGRDQPAAHD
ncbi:hypothetical protein [Microtetraspora niveoalba]|uniref:hypothetical protein n=1 Tax=Microtetraspora niveoalba TaxID=46175 RepID=UPI0012F9F5FF|nr:hypothetical protein [Microtetraspora niveoalba]